MRDELQLSVPRVAFMYVSALMGAGFASGKEIWQFFGIFGLKGLFGIGVTTFFFVFLGFIIVWIGTELDTDDISKIILPVRNPLLEKLVGFVVVGFLYMAFFSMLAAGGALFQQVLSLDSRVGSAMLMAIVVFTAVKGFARVSDAMGRVAPVLLVGTLALCTFLVGKFYTEGGINSLHQEAMEQLSASPLTGSWPLAALAYVSYNMLGAVAILGGCAHIGTDKKKVKKGVVRGGVILGLCALILYSAVSTDPLTSAEASLPMLELSRDVGLLVSTCYGVILLVAIFGTATSCFYSMSTKMPKGKFRKWILVAVAISGLCFSFLGFEAIVAVIYPVEGYVAVVFLLLMVANAAIIKKRKLLGREAIVKLEELEVGETQNGRTDG